MKYKTIVGIIMIIGLLYIPQMHAMASEHSDSISIVGNDKYSYTFKLLKDHNVSFDIVDTEGDSVPVSYVMGKDTTQYPLDFDSNSTSTVYLEAGVYTLYIANIDDNEKYYDININIDITDEDISKRNKNAVEAYNEYIADAYAWGKDTNISYAYFCKNIYIDWNNELTEYDYGENSDFKEIREIKFDLSAFDSTKATINGEILENIEVAAGDWFTLEVQYVNGGAPSATDIEYSFSNKGCISIQDQEYGKFNALKEGDCVITATYGDASIKINVHIYDVKYSIKKEEYTLRYGKTIAVDFVRDDKKYANEVLKATSSDKKIAVYDMDKELIVAKKAGTCTLTFTMKNGQKVTCKVTVPKFTLLENIDSQVAYSSDLSKIYTETINKIKYPYANVFIGNRLKDTKTITYVEYSVYQYDNKGNRVNESSSDFTWNDNIYGGSFIHVYTSANVKKYHSCVKKVYYEDGSTWSNPYYKEWATKYKSKY